MKRKFFALIAASIIFLLTGCAGGSQSDASVTETDAPHTFSGYPVVYLTTDVSARGLLSVYEALEPISGGTVGIKLSGEMPESTFSWAELTAELTQMEDVAVIENDGPATEFSGYDSTLFVTHFKPYDTVGFYGTVAHLASVSAPQEDLDGFTSDADEMMRYFAELGNVAVKSLNEPVLYIAVLDHWSIGDPAYDRAIVSSYDPVSLDQACVDLVNMTDECQSLASHIAACDGIYTLVNAEQMGWGSRTYALLSIDL